MAALTSPVRALSGATALQSWAPIRTGVSLARPAAMASMGAGGQINTSMDFAVSPTRRAKRAISPKSAWRPNIFQFPAISGFNAAIGLPSRRRPAIAWPPGPLYGPARFDPRDDLMLLQWRNVTRGVFGTVILAGIGVAMVLFLIPR